MPDILDFVDDLLVGPSIDPKATYDRVAAHYEEFRALWLHVAGGTVERVMLDDLAAILAPGQRVLDAGSGTGTLARRIQAMEPSLDLTLLDLSPAMLARTGDVHAEKVEGSVLDLPFLDETFDVVVSSWVIETVPDPIRAVQEYLRVITPTGYILYTFCSLPDG